MGWWFGRKSAPDTRPLVPAWLSTHESEGFARSDRSARRRKHQRYRVRVAGSANAFSVETTTPEIRLTAAQLAALGPGIATVTVTQLGDYAESRAASISITLS